jgi:hypothetical protein
MTAGAYYVAYGDNAIAAYLVSRRSLQEHNNTLPIACVGVGQAFDILGKMPGYSSAQKARWAKVNLDRLSPFDQTLYLDADTRIYGDVSMPFDILEHGWDICIAPSVNQGARLLWHLDPGDKERTITECGAHALQMQCGVFYFRKSARIHEFFGAWRAEWLRYCGQDQGAFMRALLRVPVRVWQLGRAYNGGALIGHAFGKARE